MCYRAPPNGFEKRQGDKDTHIFDKDSSVAGSWFFHGVLRFYLFILELLNDFDFREVSNSSLRFEVLWSSTSAQELVI